MSPNVLDIIILTVTCGCGWLLIAYEGYAIPRGLTVGAWLAGDFSWLQGLAYVGIVGAVVLSFIVSVWWTAVIVIVGANVLARVILPIFKAQSQIVGIVGLLVGFVASGIVALT